MKNVTLRLFKATLILVIILSYHGKSILAQQALIAPGKQLMFDNVAPSYVANKFSTNLKRSHSELSFTRINKDFLNEIIVKKIQSGEITTYEYTNFESIYKNRLYPLLLTEALIKLGFRSDTVPDFENDKGYSVQLKEINAKEIKSYLFYEEWSFDTTNLIFSKTPIYWGPIRTWHTDNIIKRGAEENFPIDSIGSSLEYCFLIQNKKTKKHPELKLVAKLKTEFLIHHQHFYSYFFPLSEEIHNDYQVFIDELAFMEKENCPFWNSIDKSTLCDFIFNLNKIKDKSYDFTNPSKKLSETEIKNILFPKEKISIYDFSKEEYIDTLIANPIQSKDIISFIFFEEWFLDEENLYLEKKITAIAPVIIAYDDVQGIIIEKPLYVVKLNN